MKSAKDIAYKIFATTDQCSPLGKSAIIGVLELAIKEAQIDALEEAAKIAAQYHPNDYIHWDGPIKIVEAIRAKAKELK